MIGRKQACQIRRHPGNTIDKPREFSVSRAGASPALEFPPTRLCCLPNTWPGLPNRMACQYSMSITWEMRDRGAHLSD